MNTSAMEISHSWPWVARRLAGEIVCAGNMNDVPAASFRAPPLAALPRDDDGLRNYTIFIRDERYSVPTVRFVTVVSETRAAELAAALLLESHHHLAVGASRHCHRPSTGHDRHHLWFVCQQEAYRVV